MADQRKSIKSWAEDDRPREKLRLKGSPALSNAELIAILISTGNREESAVELSKRILHDVDQSLSRLARRSLKELMQFKGIGEAKAITIAAALELGRRRSSEPKPLDPTIHSSKTAYEIFLSSLADLNYERFCVIMLNRANHLIRCVTISEGGIVGTVADLRKIFKMALELNATSLILGHNHPSGQLKPSDEDLRLTKKMQQAGQLLEITVLDHIIVGNNEYYSFADEGKM